MEIVYTGQKPPESFSKSCFLAGPTPRDKNVQSWRPEALAILKLLNYDGVVFVPENPPGGQVFNDWENPKDKYKSCVDWEDMALNMSDCIVFWIPRDIATMPAFTTNDEWGTWKYSGKTVLGCPTLAAKTRYQEYYADKLQIPFANTLAETLQNAVNFIGEAPQYLCERADGFRNIPLFILKTNHMQEWIKSLLKNNNRLDHAKVLWQFGVGDKKRFPFAYTIHTDIFVSAENRNKSNEFVFFRTDISCVVLYRKKQNINDSEILLVKEFRSSVRNNHGFVYELPGGSSAKPGEPPMEVASNEVFEETGLKIDYNRFRLFLSRQVCATLSTHHALMFAAEITEEELNFAKMSEATGKAFGNADDSELTYIKVVTLEDILEQKVPVDWAMTGMILRALI